MIMVGATAGEKAKAETARREAESGQTEAAAAKRDLTTQSGPSLLVRMANTS
jgi:hypothetical protein